jgi:hypothetical protein
MWILYLRRYHMKATNPPTSRVTVVVTPMTALAAVPTCGVVELNRIVRIGSLRKEVSKP